MTTFATRSASTATSNVHCAPCKFVGNITPAAKFCLDCGGHLCSSCVTQHRKGEHTKSHNVTLITDIPANNLSPGNTNRISPNSFSSFKSDTNTIQTTNAFTSPFRISSQTVDNSTSHSEPESPRSTSTGSYLSPVTSNLRSASASTYKTQGRVQSTVDGGPKSPAPVTSNIGSASSYTSSVPATGLLQTTASARAKSPAPVTSSLRPASANNYNSTAQGTGLLQTTASARAKSPAPVTSRLQLTSTANINKPTPPIRNKLLSNPDEVFIYDDHATEHRDKTDGLSNGHKDNGPSTGSAGADIARDKQAAQKLESSIKRLQDRFEHAQTDGEESLRKLEQTGVIFDGSVTKFRKTIVDLLDKLEAAIMKGKQKIYYSKVAEVQERMKTCQTAVSTLTAQTDKLQTAHSTDDDAEAILATRMTQEVVRRYDRICTDMEKAPKNIGFHFLPDPAIEQFFKYKTDLGVIKDDSKPVNVTMVTNPARKSLDSASSMTSLQQLESKLKLRGGVDTADTGVAETVASLRSYTAEEVNARLPTDTKPCSITGSVFLPADGLCVADATNKTVKLFTPDFQISSSLEMTSAPRDVASISSTEVAVTLPNDKSVQIIKIGKELAVTKIIKLDIECYGISCFKDELYVTSGWSPEKVVCVITVEGSLKKKIFLDKDVLKCPLYVIVDPKNLHIYVSDYENGIVCLDMTGSVIFHHSDSSTKGYMGITSSQTGEVYVSTLQPNGISRVHREKRHGSRLDQNHLETLIYLPNKGGQSPRSISFSRRSRKIAVSFVGMNMDSLSVYSI